MFENILWQNDVTQTLSNAIETRTLPGSLLFCGQALSAKLSTALELARVLSCEKNANWNCDCKHCSHHRTLTHQDVLLLGPKKFREELKIAVEMIENNPSASSRFFFIRSVRKLTKRFDSVLYNNEENKLSKVTPLLRTIMEGLDNCNSDNKDTEALKKEAKKLLPVCIKLSDLLPSSIPVFQIRNIEFQARLAPISSRKTIIIEHADLMPDASRNALLKILEEPPEHTVFILTTSRKQAIIPTILSRVRKVQFVQRTNEETNNILSRIFHTQNSSVNNLSQFFSLYRDTSENELEKLAREFALSLIKSKNDFSTIKYIPTDIRNINIICQDILKLTNNFGSSDDEYAWTFETFLDYVGNTFSSLIKNNEANINLLRYGERFAFLARDAIIRYQAYNIQGASLLERISNLFMEDSLD